MAFVAGIASIIFASLMLATPGLQIGSQVHAYEAESARADGAAARPGPTEEQATYWRYAPENFMSVKPRMEPHINSLQHQAVIKPGELLKVSREQRGEDGVVYLQLAEDGGWLFDKKPGVGTMCVREVFMDAPAFLEAKASYLGNAASKAKADNAKVEQAKAVSKAVALNETAKIAATEVTAASVSKTAHVQAQGVPHTSVMPARKAVDAKIGTAGPVIHRPLENSSAAKVPVDDFAKPTRTRLGLYQESAAEGEMVAMKAEAMKAEALDAARQGTDQEFNPLNVTAPQLIEAGLEIALPSAFGLGQTNVNMTRTTMCKGGYRPILLRTGQYSCDLPYDKGTLRYYLHAFFKMICDLFNLSRLVLSLIFISIALVGTYAVEVFYFRRKYKGPQYEVIGTDMSEEHPKEALGQIFGSDAKGDKTDESAVASATSRKPPEPIKELNEIAKELSALAPGVAAPRNRWGLRQFVSRLVPQPFHCRRRRSPAQ